MSRSENISFSKKENYPLLTREQTVGYTKIISCQEIAGFLLEDINSGIRDEKGQLKKHTLGDPKKAALSREAAEDLLKELNLFGRITLEFDENEKYKTNRPLTPEEKSQRKAVIGYSWEEGFLEEQEKEQLTIRLQNKIHAGNEAKTTLLNHNLGLVTSVANRSRYYKLPIEDREQAAALGLIRAIQGFDYRTEFEFSTYATISMQGRIQKTAFDEVRTIQYPRHIEHVISLAQGFYDKYITEHGSVPSLQEWEDVIKKEKPETSSLWIKQAIELISSGKMNIASLDKQLGEDGVTGGQLLNEILADSANTEEEALDSVENEQKARALSAALSKFPEDARGMVMEYVAHQGTYTNLAKTYHRSPQTIKNIIDKTMDSLREDAALRSIWQETEPVLPETIYERQPYKIQ